MLLSEMPAALWHTSIHITSICVTVLRSR